MAELQELTVHLPRLLRHGYAYKNDLGEVHTSIPERLPHIEYDSAIPHICKGGEYVQDLAVLYYKAILDYAVDAAEIIAQYQDDPIVDISVPLDANRVIMIPPLLYIQEVAYSDSLAETPRIV